MSTTKFKITPPDFSVDVCPICGYEINPNPILSDSDVDIASYEYAKQVAYKRHKRIHYEKLESAFETIEEDPYVKSD